MGKIAFVFSGQGAQAPGMGKDLYENNTVAKVIFDRCDGIRPCTSTQCFSGTKEELTITANTQPDMFAVELAAAYALEAEGIRPDALAGFSLGEISALTFSNAVTLEDGFRLVIERGRLMQAAAESVESSMVAVVKLAPAVVEDLTERFDQVYPVNYNGPGQTVCAGLTSSMEGFKAAVKDAGGRALPLKVAGGFHSPFMNSAAAGLVDILNGIEINEASIPLYSNVTAVPYQSGEYRTLLSKQVVSPVRWQNIVENMIADGIDTFIEVGPGKTLCGLISKIRTDVKILNVEDMASLEQTVKEVLG